VQLWELGLVPSFDGKVWRLHGGEKAAVLFEITAENLHGLSAGNTFADCRVKS